MSDWFHERKRSLNAKRSGFVVSSCVLYVLCADAASRHAALVLITMDTPGGLSVSMQDMIQHILASPVPVAVYVSPTGGRGASAGFYILLSADVAAMAPGTHTGSATPVMAIGGFLPMQIDD